MCPRGLNPELVFGCIKEVSTGAGQSPRKSTSFLPVTLSLPFPNTILSRQCLGVVCIGFS